MPQTLEKRTPELAIDLDREHPAFTLPDTIIGHVFRQAPIVTSEAVLAITLLGRTKSRMVVRHGSWGNIYRGRFPLVDETQTLLRGPLHIAADCVQTSWWFTVTLPTQYDPAWTPTGKQQRDESFLALSPEASAARGLPSSFRDEKWGYGEGMGCFVEYFLRAELTTTHRGKANVVEAIQPLTVTTLHRGARPRHAPMRELRQVHSLTRRDSVTEYSNARDASGRVGSQATATSLRPGLDFDIVVRTPTALHLDQSGHIPVCVTAEPRPTTASDATLLISQEILVSEILVELVASTSIKCRSRKGPRQDNIETRVRLCKRTIDREIAALAIPWGGDSAMTHIYDDDDPLQMLSRGTQDQTSSHGRLLGLHLPSEGVSESFTTHNIQHRHRLEWKVDFQVAGQSFTSSGSNALDILAPSRDDAPTDYVRSEAETMVRRDSARVEAGPPEYSQVEQEEAAPCRGRQQSQAGGAAGLSRLWGGY